MFAVCRNAGIAPKDIRWRLPQLRRPADIEDSLAGSACDLTRVTARLRSSLLDAAILNLLPSERPLRNAAQSDIALHFRSALARGDGLLGAQCVHEMWMRGAFPSNVEQALKELWSCAADSIPDWLPMRYVDWLPAAYEAALGFRASGKGRSNIYMVLLDYRDRRGGDYGVYVGMSKYSPAQRFDQHKAGIRSAGSVLKRGLEVLTGPTLHLQWIKRADAERIEAGLAEALASSGITVKGGH